MKIKSSVLAILGPIMRDVREFHEAFDHPRPTTPTLLDRFHADRRSIFIRSECDELEEAKTVAEQADAFIDIIYFAAGGLVELGIDPSPLWNLTHSANMAKLWPDGTIHKDPETGKTLKPPGWQDPTPAQELEVKRQIGRVGKDSGFHWYYSLDEEAYYGPYEAREDAIAEGRNNTYETFHIVEAKCRDLSEYIVNADSLMEHVIDQIDGNSEMGDESFEFTGTPEDYEKAKADLDSLLQVWRMTNQKLFGYSWLFCAQRNAEVIPHGEETDEAKACAAATAIPEEAAS